MLRIHCLQLWWNLSDLAMEGQLHERRLYRWFAGLAGSCRIPDETTILRFRYLLEKHELAPKILLTIDAGLAAHGLMLKTGTLVDATLIAAPSSTENKAGTRDPEMHQTKKGNQWHFGMKAYIGVDAESGLAHTVSVRLPTSMTSRRPPVFPMARKRMCSVTPATKELQSVMKPKTSM